MHGNPGPLGWKVKWTPYPVGQLEFFSLFVYTEYTEVYYYPSAEG